MHKSVSISELVPVFSEILQNGGTVRFTPTGNSMLPMLSAENDEVILKKKNNIKKYDVVLFYRHSDNVYVLHRVVRVKNDGTFTMCGDNQLLREHGIKKEDIIGVVSRFKHDGSEKSCNNFFYKFYCRKLLLIKQFKWIYYWFLRKIKKDN